MRRPLLLDDPAGSRLRSAGIEITCKIRRQHIIIVGMLIRAHSSRIPLTGLKQCNCQTNEMLGAKERTDWRRIVSTGHQTLF